jgi:enoyl-CoA hydratase
MAESVLLVDRRDGIATLTLNRPDQMNALSMELRRALEVELTALRSDREIGVVILTGAGRAFCAGLDLKEMGSRQRSYGDAAPQDPPALLRALRQPVIGAINGVAVTGGLEIALSCDVLVATPETRFADTHARVGLIAGWGLGAQLSRAIGLRSSGGSSAPGAGSRCGPSAERCRSPTRGPHCPRSPASRRFAVPQRRGAIGPPISPPCDGRHSLKSPRRWSP